MKIRRSIHNKYKEKMWLINISVDKYIWIKKPKYIIKQIAKILFNIIKFPFFLIGFILMCMYESTKQIVIFSKDMLVEFLKDIIKLFPSYVQVTDENELISEPKLKEFNK